MTIKNTPLTDPLKTTILDKARSCFPPVNVEIFAERGRTEVIVRIEIPPGDFKPYCTHGGTYKIRGDGANAAIKPPALLQMFLEREGSQFLARFSEATRELEGNVLTLKNNVEAALQGLYEDVRQMDEKIEFGLNEVVDQATQAVSEAEESTNAAQSIDDRLGHLEGVMLTVRSQAELLLQHHGLEDPRVTEIKKRVFPEIEKLWEEQPRRRRSTYLKFLRKRFSLLNPDYLAQLYDQKVAEQSTK
jgi:hypothetical protein